MVLRGSGLHRRGLEVRRDYAVSDIWWVAAHADDRPFTVVATDPLCPRCGTTLCLPAELAHHVEDNIFETGRVLESGKSARR
jgi:hypothetical protein